MEFLLLLVLAIVTIGALIKTVDIAARRRFEEHSAKQPLDPTLSVALHYPPSAGWKGRRDLETDVRRLESHIRRLVLAQGDVPVLIMELDSVLRDGGLLVVTDRRTLAFVRDRVNAVSHASGTTTSISASESGNLATVTVVGDDGRMVLNVGNLTRARLVCAAIDIWIDEPGISAVPAMFIGPRDVSIPEAAFVGVLRSTGHAATQRNVLALQERFGMLIYYYVRRQIDSSIGLTHGEQFAAKHTRPQHDQNVARWPEQMMQSLIALDSDFGHTIGPFLPGRVLGILGERYLAQPHQPLSMWRSSGDTTGPPHPMAPPASV